MTIEVLHVPDCPNVDELVGRLREVTSQPVRLREIATENDARRYGMAGSPTLLVNGVDPFAAGPPTLACRLGPAPTVEQLRAALGKASAAAALSPPAREAHVAILGWFVDNGSAPTRAELEARVSPTALDELVARDLVALDAAGELRAAYPFSPTPTRHRVVIDDGPELFSMCAIDALGTSAMLGRAVTIRSTEPDSDTAIEIRVDGDRATWQPSGTVVLAGSTDDSCCQASVDTTCGSINFFGTREAARAWAERNPHLTSSVLDQDEALRCGIAEFGAQLKGTRASTRQR